MLKKHKIPLHSVPGYVSIVGYPRLVDLLPLISDLQVQESTSSCNSYSNLDFNLQESSSLRMIRRIYFDSDVCNSYSDRWSIAEQFEFASEQCRMKVSARIQGGSQ